jgi:transcriptional regulator with GAF, ATPase, and Fis domain
VPAERNVEEEIATKVRPPATAGSTATPAFELVVIEGPDAGAHFPLDRSGPTRLLIGQSPACGVRLSDPHVSRRHAALHHAGLPEVQLTDLGSKNGTFLNGVRIADVFLRGDEVIRMGESAMRLELVDGAEAVPIPTASRFGRIVGASVEMRRLYPLLQRLAATDVAVVIEGETGTGKELLAESLHAEGPRADKPFMVFDCTTLAPSLVEVELFGQEGDASTATAARKGLFELAHGGTLFIDEIGDLDLSLQPKLLRAIERSEVRRVGGDRWLPVDVRIIAATRRDLDAEVQAGRFRDDLFLRLAITRIELPPLRARIGDVPVLAQHFWRELGGGARVLPYDLLQRCEAYRWPGNVRELYNEIARRLALGDLEDAARARPSPDAALAAEDDDTPQDFLDSVLELDLPLPHSRARLLDEFHRRYVERVVTQHGGNIRRAAAASGIAHRYFQILRARNTK